MLSIPEKICAIFGHHVTIIVIERRNGMVIKAVSICQRCGFYGILDFSDEFESPAPVEAPKSDEINSEHAISIQDESASVPTSIPVEFAAAPPPALKTVTPDRLIKSRCIGTQIIAWCDRRKMKHKDLRELAGLGGCDYSNYKNDKRRAGGKILDRFADALNITVEEFLAGPPEIAALPAETKVSVNSGKQIGTVLDAWMTAKARSHDAVSSLTGINRRVLAGIIDDKITVNNETLGVIAMAFHVTPAAFLAGPKEPPVRTD